MNNSNQNLYEILKVNQTDDQEQIKSSYRQLCQDYHPDKLPLQTPEPARKLFEEHFKSIVAAYEILSNPELRMLYDQELNQSKNRSDYSSNPVHPVSFSLDYQRLQQAEEKLKKLKESRIKIIEEEFESKQNQIKVELLRNKNFCYLTENEIQGDSLTIKIFQFIVLAPISTLSGLAISITALIWFPSLWNVIVDVKSYVFLFTRTVPIFDSLLALIWLAINFGIRIVVAGGIWFLVLMIGVALLVCGWNVFADVFRKPLLEESIAKIVYKFRESQWNLESEPRNRKVEQLAKLEESHKKRIEIYKSKPLFDITDDFIKALSEEEILFFLTGVKYRLDEEAREKATEKTLQGVGAFALGAILITLGGGGV